MPKQARVEPAQISRSTAALLGVVLYVEALGTVILLVMLAGLLGERCFRSGGNWIGGIAIAMVFFAAAIILGILGLATSIFVAVRRTRSGPCLPEDLWQSAARGASLGTLLGLGVMISEAVTPILALCIVLSAGGWWLLSLIRIRRWSLAVAVLPALVVLVGVAIAAHHAVTMRTKQRPWDIGQAMADKDQARLDRLLKRASPGSLDLDGPLTETLLYQDALPQVEEILRSNVPTNTACVTLLRAVLADGVSEFGQASDPLNGCVGAALVLAARLEKHKALRLLAQQHPPEPRRWQPPTQAMRLLMVKLHEPESYRRLLADGGLLNGAGKLDPRYYHAGDFRHGFLSHLDPGVRRDQVEALLDLDALLVVECAQSGNLTSDASWRISELLKRGADPNAKVDCGSTPLSALTSDGAFDEGIYRTLLSGGANPNLGGTPYCLDPWRPTKSAKPRSPLGMLMQRSQQTHRSSPLAPPEIFQLLLEAGANAREKDEWGLTPDRAIGDGVDPSSKAKVAELIRKYAKNGRLSAE